MNKRKSLLLVLDMSVIFFSGILSLFIRFGWDFNSIMTYSSPVLISTALCGFSLLINGTYRIIWAYMNNSDILVLIRGVLIGFVLSIMTDLITPFVLPKSVVMTQYLSAAILLILTRIWWVWRLQSKNILGKTAIQNNICIIGAGEAGVLILEDINKNPTRGKVCCFIDDSSRKIGRKIRGISVYGPISSADEILKSKNIDEIIIAIPSADSGTMKNIISFLDLKKYNVSVMPALSEIIGKKTDINSLRKISIEDLLGREPVKIDLEGISRKLQGKTVMVTGAGGSIGGEIARQIANLKPSRIVLLGRGENSIYNIEQEFSVCFPELIAHRIIADITDKKHMESIFAKYRPDIVFHAAAHKHVPLMEENPSEAFRVNSSGTSLIVDMAIKYGVERFTLISTDKAVNPTSIMGVSKRLAEMYLRAVSRENKITNFSVVRFGNVLGSRGSVIPKFKKQIDMGGPVTITHPDMKRYFMTIPEAASLVIQASNFASNGDLFILDMGEQIYIRDLVEKMIILSGFVPEQDIKIIYTGIRKGEKLYEELFLDCENAIKTEHPKVFRVRDDEKFSREELSEIIKRVCEYSLEDKHEELLEIIKIFAPDNMIKNKEV